MQGVEPDDKSQTVTSARSGVLVGLILAAVLTAAVWAFVLWYSRYGLSVVAVVASHEPENVFRTGMGYEHAGMLPEAVTAYRRALALGIDRLSSYNDCRHRLAALAAERGRIPGYFPDMTLNLLHNAGFQSGETTVAAWADGIGPQADGVSLDERESVEGGKSLRADLSHCGSLVAVQRLHVLPRAHYQLAYWIRLDRVVVGTVRVAIERADDKGTSPLVFDEETGTTDWTQHTLDFAIPEGVRQIAVDVRVDGTGGGKPSGFLWIDSFLLQRSQMSYLRNGDFELGPNGDDSWLGKRVDGVHVTADTNIAIEGRQALRVELPASASLGLWQSADVTPGAHYKLSGWIRTEGLEDGATLEANIEGADPAKRHFATNPITGTCAWTPVSFDVAIPEQTGTLVVLLVRTATANRTNAPGTIWFDGISLERTDAKRN